MAKKSKKNLTKYTWTDLMAVVNKILKTKDVFNMTSEKPRMFNSSIKSTIEGMEVEIYYWKDDGDNNQLRLYRFTKLSGVLTDMGFTCELTDEEPSQNQMADTDDPDESNTEESDKDSTLCQLKVQIPSSKIEGYLPTDSTVRQFLGVRVQIQSQHLNDSGLKEFEVRGPDRKLCYNRKMIGTPAGTDLGVLLDFIRDSDEWRPYVEVRWEKRGEFDSLTFLVSQ